MVADRSHSVRADRPASVAGGTVLRWQSRFHRGLQILARGVHAHHYGYHLHEPLKIAWLLSGTATVTYRGQTWQLEAGDAFLAAPFEPHGGHTILGESLSFVSLFVPRMLVGEIEHTATAGTGPLPGFVVHLQALDLYEALSGCLREAETPTRQIEVLISTLRAFLSPAGASIPCWHGTTHRAVRRMRALLDDAFDEHVTVGDLARAVHLHERYVISLFKRALGIPPHQYLIARRVERARLLLDEHRPPGAAAMCAGFSDHSHFTRIFRSTYGCTPHAYQQGLNS